MISNIYDRPVYQIILLVLLSLPMLVVLCGMCALHVVFVVARYHVMLFGDRVT